MAFFDKIHKPCPPPEKMEGIPFCTVVLIILFVHQDCTEFNYTGVELM